MTEICSCAFLIFLLVILVVIFAVRRRESLSRTIEVRERGDLAPVLRDYLTQFSIQEKDVLLAFRPPLMFLLERFRQGRFAGHPDRWHKVLETVTFDTKVSGDVSRLDSKILAKRHERVFGKFLEDIPMLAAHMKRRGLAVNEVDVLEGMIWFLEQFWQEHATSSVREWKRKYGVGLSDPAEIAKRFIKTDETDLPLERSLLLLLKHGYEMPVHPATVKNLVARANEEIELDKFERETLGIHGKTTIRDILGYHEHLNGYEFESYLMSVFEKLGWDAIRTGGSGDQGADLILKRDNRAIVVQAKRYSSPIPNTAIQEAVAAVKFYGADGAMVVTNSTFTDGAVELAMANNVELWDGAKLDEVLQSPIRR